MRIRGSKDVLVEPEQNVNGLRATLPGADESRLIIRILPDMNHMFQKCQTGNVDEFFKIKGCMDPAVLDLISGWIAKQTRQT